MKRIAATVLAAVAVGAQAQDAERGRQLYDALPGKPGVGSCAACHGDPADNINSVLRGGAGAGLISRTINAVGAMGYLRQFLSERDLADIASYLATVSPRAAQPLAPQVGPRDADFATVDALAQAHLARSGAPGLTLVIAAGERIVYAQAYGLADRLQHLAASPWLEQRLADLSMAMTAAAVLRLVEQGRLALDSPAWQPLAATLAVEPADPRLRSVTLRQLLTHRWGLDTTRSPQPAAGWMQDGDRVLTDCRDLLARYARISVLDFAPGAQQAPNRLGYCWAGLLAEAVDGRPLAQQISAMLGVEPLSGVRVRIGDVRPQERSAIEVVHHDAVGVAPVQPVPGLFAASASVLPAQGGYSLNGFGGAAGLVASPLTLTRFVQRLVGARAPALLAEGSRRALLFELEGGVRTAAAWPGAGEQRVSATGQLGGTQGAWIAAPRQSGGPTWTLVALLNGDSAAAPLLAGLLEPVLAEIDRLGPARLAAKPEIAAERLIAWGSASEAAFADLLFDWGERSFPALLRAPAAAKGVAQGYRFRYYAGTDTYVGVRDGRVDLLQPAVSPLVSPVGTLGDYLPQVLQALDRPGPLRGDAQRARR